MYHTTERSQNTQTLESGVINRRRCGCSFPTSSDSVDCNDDDCSTGLVGVLVMLLVHRRRLWNE